MPDEKEVDTQTDEEEQLFSEEASPETEASEATPPGQETPAAAAAGAIPDRKAIEYDVLTDKGLSSDDYARAQADPKFLSELIDARIEEQKNAAAASKPGEEPKKESAPAAKPKARRGYQRKIERLEGQLQELQAKLQGQQPRAVDGPKTAQLPAAITKPAPQESQFNTEEEFQTAHRRWEIEDTASRIVESRLEAERQKSKVAWQKQRQDQFNRQTGELTKKLFEVGREAHEDYDDVIGDSGDVPLTDAMQHAILSSKVGHEILYQWAKNPEEATRIAGLPPNAVEREVGRIEERIESRPVDEPKESGKVPSKESVKPDVSRAPRPPNTVGGGSSQPGKNLEYYAHTASPDEFARAMYERKI